jgi:alcohol dehydrogenase (cytochrome c)
VTYEEILQGPGANWLTYSGDYQGWRYSPLKQITRENVARLVPKWTYSLGSHLETTPIVFDGVMYVTTSNEVDALDARTGRRIWRFHDDQSSQESPNRGVAVLGDRVFFVTSDAHLVALHRNTGAVLWSKEYASAEKGYYATLAPLALKDRVIVGVSGGDDGIRGFVAAFSASTGEELWRYWTIPARGEPGSETWSEFPAEYGGGATWMTGTFDPELNLIYWPTGNPWPDLYGPVRRGDNLYTCSMLALDADTGRLRWYFQFTPHDIHDWDAQAIPVLVNTNFQGRRRKLLLHANRNGFFYVLDRTNGRFLHATPFVQKLNWATGVDGKGRPIEAPNLETTPKGTKICPSLRGATNWMSPSYSAQTGLLYVRALERCDLFSIPENPANMLVGPKRGVMTGSNQQVPSEPGKFFLRALDPETGEKRWEYPMTGPGTMWAGTMSTAGGLVFFGDDDGQFVAVDAESGKNLWHYFLGQFLTASPMTFSIDGKQYVGIAAGADVFTFGLFEPAIPVILVPTREQ